MIISRSLLKKKLQEYVDSKITLKDIIKWEEETYKLSRDFDDWEQDDSFANEVLSRISMSDVDGLNVEEAKKIIKLLDSKDNTKELINKLYSM